MRISKYLSLCGVTSRRGAEALISKGQVTVNDTTVDKLGTIIDESTDVVKVNGTRIEPVDEKVYIVINKPGNVLTTLFDPFRRRTILHYLKTLEARVYPVGRLDYDTEGVLLLSNDGDLAFRLSHPRYKIQRIYEAHVLGHMTPEACSAIKQGIKLDDGAIGHAEVSILGFVKSQSRIRLILREGRKREVKQLCRKVGYPVRHLRRVDFAGITTKGLAGGQWRHLSKTEIKRLQSLVNLRPDE